MAGDAPTDTLMHLSLSGIQDDNQLKNNETI